MLVNGWMFFSLLACDLILVMWVAISTLDENFDAAQGGEIASNIRPNTSPVSGNTGLLDRFFLI